MMEATLIPRKANDIQKRKGVSSPAWFTQTQAPLLPLLS